jgi:hypothetical protein
MNHTCRAHAHARNQERKAGVIYSSVACSLVVVLQQLRDDRLCPQVTSAIVVIGLVADCAVEAFHDAVGLRMPRSALDVDQAVRLSPFDMRAHDRVFDLRPVM